MDPQKRGAHNEGRFFEAATRLISWKRKLVLEVRRASPALDARGVDGIIKIALPKGSKRESMSVPIEIKSSRLGVNRWKLVHRDHHDAGVLVFYIKASMPQHRLSKLIFRALDRVHRNSRNGTLYVSWWQRVFRGRGSKNLKKNIATIKSARARARQKK
ncbi:MAG: hypothetical protein KBE09_03205 [Candidatus Pacebacteria bacterium]|nr:hypothetical protein [Candidatus Paceibacterota bacterium]